MNYLPLLQISNIFYKLESEEGLRIFITYYFQFDNCYQGQQFASKLAKRHEISYSSQRSTSPQTCVPNLPTPKKLHSYKNERCQEHVLNSHLSRASERGVVFSEDSGWCTLRRGPWFSLVVSAGRAPSQPTWVAFSTDCWQEIDYSNVTGTQTCSLPSRRYIELTFRKYACCLRLRLFCWQAHRIPKLLGCCSLDDWSAGFCQEACLSKLREAHFLPRWAVPLASHLLCPPARINLGAASFGSPPGAWSLMWSWWIGKREEILLSFKNKQQNDLGLDKNAIKDTKWDNTQNFNMDWIL